MRKAHSTSRRLRINRALRLGSLLALVAGASVTAQARVLPVFQTPPVTSTFVTTQRDAGGPVTLEQAVEIAQRRYGGTVAGARTITRNGRQVHEVRILGDDGIVRTVLVDADTGEVR